MHVDVVDDVNDLHQQAMTNIHDYQQKTQQHQPPMKDQYLNGDLVTIFDHTTANKLTQRSHGPYRIIEQDSQHPDKPTIDGVYHFVENLLGKNPPDFEFS